MRIPVAVCAGLLAAAAALPQSQSFTGEIMDTPCAAMQSHAKMMQGMGAKNAADCTEKCVRAGGRYALFDASTKTTYLLDNSSKAAAFAGQKVIVKGTYDAANKMIHLESLGPR
jgi:hypothetical protein